MVNETKSEDTILVIDASSSMFRKDVTPAQSTQQNGAITRSSAVLLMVKTLVNKKHELDSNDRFGIVVFSSEVQSLEDLVYNYDGINQFLLNTFEMRRGTALGEALSRAVKLIINELRKIGEKQSRIILFTDGLVQDTQVNPIKIAKIAQGLGIMIDAIRVGPAKTPGNIIKRITEITGGEYEYANDLQSLRSVTLKIAAKKLTGVKTLLDKNNTVTQNIFENEIAGTLLKIEDLSAEEREEHLYKPERMKKLQCSICYSDKCASCKVNFYGCGRFCPNCLKPIHLHCAIKWAENQMKGKPKMSEDYIFRCPFCFYLLKIPISQFGPARPSIQGEEEDEDANITIEKKMFAEVTPAVLDEICPVCSTLFDVAQDKQVYKCSSCNAFFHVDCLKKATAEERRCPGCKRAASFSY